MPQAPEPYRPFGQTDRVTEQLNPDPTLRYVDDLERWMEDRDERPLRKESPLGPPPGMESLGDDAE